MKRTTGFLALAVLLVIGAGLLWTADSPDPSGDRATTAHVAQQSPERPAAESSDQNMALEPERAEPLRAVDPDGESEALRSARAGRQDDAVGEPDSASSTKRTMRTGDAERSRLREAIEAADALPGEGRLLSGGHLDAREARTLLESEAFGETVDEMAWDASRDRDAQALTDLYREYVDRILRAGGGFVLDRIACGLRLCVGQALAIIDEAKWHVHGLYGSELDPNGLPMYASTYNSFVTPDGRTFFRFMFTIDPSSPGIVVGGP